MSDKPARILSPAPEFLRDPALSAVLDALPDARVVGGAVRDALASRPVADIDLATPCLPDQVIAAVEAKGLRAVPTGLDHGTVTAVSGGRGFEVTTLRRDVATDGRRAVVAFTDDWKEDAARRDFTINALSMSRDGAVFDYFGGIADLHAGIVRFVGDAHTRIAEDYLRILRYFRFFARYESGPPDAAAIEAIRGGVPGLARLSAERVWSELSRILAAPDPRAAMAMMQQLGVLAAVIPEGADPVRLNRLVASGAPADPILRLAALLTGDAATFAMRLRLPLADQERLVLLKTAPLAHPGNDDAALRRLLADNDAAALSGRTWLCGDGGEEWQRLRARLTTMPKPVFPLEGRDVLALGIAPGPQVGALLRAVRAWWLAGGCDADADACRAELAARVRISQTASTISLSAPREPGRPG
jgi:poly(A) polymerase/tRNA nucleotidyltransferase (CCA-adding enzyme)